MLLCPQHMQQQDLYHEQNLAARLSALTPMHWGVVAQSFDASAVKAGLIPNSMLESRDFEHVVVALERATLGPLARRV